MKRYLIVIFSMMLSIFRDCLTGLQTWGNWRALLTNICLWCPHPLALPLNASISRIKTQNNFQFYWLFQITTRESNPVPDIGHTVRTGSSLLCPPMWTRWPSSSSPGGLTSSKSSMDISASEVRGQPNLT
jgi:hypothetical protein